MPDQLAGLVRAAGEVIAAEAPAAFERAVDRIAEVTRDLLGELVTQAPPKDREVEAAKRRYRSAKRYATA